MYLAGIARGKSALPRPFRRAPFLSTSTGDWQVCTAQLAMFKKVPERLPSVSGARSDVDRKKSTTAVFCKSAYRLHADGPAPAKLYQSCLLVGQLPSTS